MGAAKNAVHPPWLSSHTKRFGRARKKLIGPSRASRKRRNLPRSFKRDVAETAKRSFKDSRSFIAQGSGCEVLYGEDKLAVRVALHERAKGRCEADVHSPYCRGFAGWNEGEWHHTYFHHGKRCDCLSASIWVSKACHRAAHSKRNPRFGEESAVEARFGKSCKLTEEASDVANFEA